jgi:hypothetical protein
MPKSRDRWVTELVQLLECPRVEQQIHALARRELPRFMLAAKAILAAAEARQAFPVQTDDRT